MAQVLVTGSAGRIGGAAYQALLARGHTVRGFDLVRPQQTPHAVIGDLAHFDQVREALCGMDTVVHAPQHPTMTISLEDSSRTISLASTTC